MNYWFGEFAPQRVLLDLGVVQIFWYSVLVVFGIVVAYSVVRRLYLRDNESDKDISDLSFYLIVCGLIGARLWHVFVFQWGYYASRPSEILKIWEGGIAIQGAIIAGLLCIVFFAHRKKISLGYFTDIIAVGLALGQAIGRWGNFFNQELYGRPTDLPWGIFIEPVNRVPGFESFTHFHPVFFYESVLNALLFLSLFLLIRIKRPEGFVASVYLMGYGIIRFLVDFVRIDPMPTALGLRSSQWISLAFVAAGLFFLFKKTARQWRDGRDSNPRPLA